MASSRQLAPENRACNVSSAGKMKKMRAAQPRQSALEADLKDLGIGWGFLGDDQA
jgi:hypothetical protein